MPSLLDTLATVLLTYAMHSVVACALALAASRSLQRPQDRDLVWKAALVAPILTVAGVMLIGVVNDRVAFIDLAELVRRGSHLRVPGRQMTVRIFDDGSGPTIVRRFVDPITSVLSMLAVGVGLSFAGIAAGRFAYRRRALSRALAPRQRVRELVDAASGLTIRLSSADDLESPVALGASEICLPAGVMTGFSDAQRDSLIAHEIAHLERRDPVWFFLAEVIAALSAFQPLIFVVTRAFRRDVELICDEAALRRTNDRHALIGALARLASPFDACSQPCGAPMAYDGSPLVARAHRIATLPIAATPRTTRRHALLRIMALVVALCSVPVFSAAPRSSDFPSDALAAARKARAEGRRVTIDSTVIANDRITRRTIVRVNQD